MTSYQIRWSSKFSKLQLDKIGQEAMDTADQTMIPQGGDVAIFFDPYRQEWTAMYRINGTQVGWQGRSKRAKEAIKDLERNNWPHPVSLDQATINQQPN